MTDWHAGHEARLPLAFWAALLCVLTIMIPDLGRAQIVSGGGSTVNQRAVYVSWDVTGDSTIASVFQSYVPIDISAALAENWEIGFATSAVQSEASWQAQGKGITGAGDTRVQIARSLSDDQVLLSAGVSLPTGQTELSVEERELIPWLTADFLNFPSKYPGEGFGAFGEAAVATPMGSWIFGAAGALHYSGEYTPFDDGRTYQPGARLVGTAGIQRDWPERARVTADLVLTLSTDDKAEGNPSFADGVRADLRITGRRSFEQGAVEAALRVILRGKNKLIGSGNADLVREAANTNGHDVRLYLGGSRTLGEKLSGWASVETKILAANQYATTEVLYEGAAQISGFGAGLDYRVSDRASFGLGGKVWTGSTDGGYTYEALDLSGYEIMQRLIVSF